MQSNTQSNMGTETKLNERKSALIVGFALFSTTFGAGNLIFPPSVGQMAGSQWVTAFVAFLISGIILPVLAFIAIGKSGGDQENLARELGARFSRFFLFVIITVACPIALPRISSLAYEISVQPFFPQIPLLWFSVLFWLATLYLAFNPLKVIDTLGAYLTPILLAGLAVILVASVLTPIGVPADVGAQGVFMKALISGYQAMDVAGINVYGGVVMAPIFFMYKDIRTQRKLVTQSGILAGIGLTLIYGSLVYLGATGASSFQPDIEKTALLKGIVGKLLGNAGSFTLAFVVFWACFTTSIGSVAGAAHSYVRILDNRVGYKPLAVVLCVVSAVIGLLSFQEIITRAVPVLLILYPCMVTLIALRLFFSDNAPKGKTGAYYGAFYATLLFSVLETLPMMGFEIPAVQSLVAALPLGTQGVCWLVPAVCCGVVGFFLTPKTA